MNTWEVALCISRIRKKNIIFISLMTEEWFFRFVHKIITILDFPSTLTHVNLLSEYIIFVNCIFLIASFSNN